MKVSAFLLLGILFLPPPARSSELCEAALEFDGRNCPKGLHLDEKKIGSPRLSICIRETGGIPAVEFGPWIRWDDPGHNSKQSQGCGPVGLPEGPFRSFHPNGKVAREGQYVFGVMEGVWKTFSETGIPLSEEPYVKGKKDGVGRTFDEFGEQMGTQTFSNNRLNSERKTPVWREKYGVSEDQEKVLETTARLVPHFRDGVETGLKILAIRKDSPWTKCGLANGTVLPGYNLGPRGRAKLYRDCLTNQVRRTQPASRH